MDNNKHITKKEKAYAVVHLVNNGYSNYFNSMKWNASKRKFTCSSQHCKAVQHMSLKQLAEAFDKLPKDVQEITSSHVKQLVGYYVEIAPNFGNEGGYETESDITSPMFKTVKQANEWLKNLTFQTPSKYAVQIFFTNYFTDEWFAVR